MIYNIQVSHGNAAKSDDPKKLAVRDFLVEVKQTVIREGVNDYGWDWVKRRENIDCLAELGFRNEDLRDVILGLSVTDYCEGPVQDFSMPGDFWVFGKVISGREIYIKLKLATISVLRIVRVVSFHPAKEKLSYPFAHEKGGEHERGYRDKG